MQAKQQKSSIFIPQLELALAKLNVDELKVVQQAFKAQNDRGKLKMIKKTLQASSQSDLKDIFRKYMVQAIVREYIFGDLQAKPVVLNIFKVLDVPSDILTGLTEHINSFQDVKKIIQITQMLSISNRLSKNSKQAIKNHNLTHKIFKCLLLELEKGKTSIIKNQFRTKWLEYFVQVLRCVNYIVRFIGENRVQFQENDKNAYQYAQQCVECSHMLTKEVITQLYLLLVYLNRDLPMPGSPLQQIHYLHACTIVKEENTLKQLLKLASELKDTQYKSQLTPILLKSFQQYFELGRKKGLQLELDQQLKQNAFDCAISLFDVGRSIYSYLQEIVDIIISKGGHWSLDGNFVRKFFIAKAALKHVKTKVILDMWPNCLEDCFIQSGNMTMPYVSDCAQALLTKIYEELNKNYSEWMKVWIQPYKKSLLSGNRSYIRGITDFINPILLKINSSNSLLLKQISSLPQQNLSTQLGIISLIKCYKQIGKIESKYNVYMEQQQRKKQQEKAKNREKKQKKQVIISQQPKKQKKQQIVQAPNFEKAVFMHLDDPQFEFGSQFLLDLLLSNDPMTALQTLDFLITSRKPSILIHPQQMKLIIEFYKNCLKTSMPQYRKSYLNLTRRMLERFRKNYEKDVTQTLKKSTQFFTQFIQFLNELINLSFLNIYPDSVFEITNPALQILLLIMNLFGPKGCQIRKGTYIEPSKILLQKTTYFKLQNFENLITCLQSSYESIRSIAHEIIKNYDNFDENGIKILRKIWSNSIENTNKLSIKSYEFACRMLTYISSIKTGDRNIIEDIPNKYSLNQLNVCEYLLEILRKRYEVFKNQFIDQSQVYYKNLIHGILTCFSYIMDQTTVISTLNEKNLEDLNNFLREFFQEMIKILNFSVEISSANISTVVLDTIANAPQAEKKLTVDCRGHFLPEKKTNTIGSFLDSTALISSMQNQQEGIQNTLVVSFYLLTREAGLVFQSIGGLMGNKFIAKHVPKKELIELVNTYFYALINLKHMGSVDRISNGLQKMAKVIFDQQDTDLIKIPEQLLNKLLQFLNDGKFTNILRRSAGVPYAFSCLLKSQAIKRKLLIENTIINLLKLSKESTETPIELRIHALNILKKLFQDSDLKQDLDIYVSEAFISSIKGFTSEQWGVRNSSLMLFSVLANRTIGIKPTYNLLQFFHKCPDLLQFITKQLSQKKAPTMYPPLYPIVLLLSRLLPFDLKQKARMTIKGGTNKQLRKQQLLSLLPLLQQAGDNHNYMGRVMTAKAILPFMYLSNIVPFCLELLQQYISHVNENKINNNAEHYKLTECYQLLKSYYEIVHNNENQSHYAQLPPQIRSKIYKVLRQNCQLLSWNELSHKISPTVQQIYIRIYQQLLNNYQNTATQKSLKELAELLQEIIENSEKLFSNLIKDTKYGDLGHSLMYKSCIELLFACYQSQIKNSQGKLIGEIFISYLNSKNSHNKENNIDYEIYSLVLEKVTDLLTAYKKKNQNQNELQKKMDDWIGKIKLENISNDDTIIRILYLLSVNPEKISAQKALHIKNILQIIKSKTQNKRMKVAIFDYVLSITKQTQNSHNQHQEIHQKHTEFLESFLNQYSNPDQLEDLRECCIFYLQQAKQLKSSLLIVYLRLLEDQQYEIRKRAAFEISRLLKIRPCNQMVVTRELISRYISGKSYVEKLKNENKNLHTQIVEMNLQQKHQFFLKLLQQNSDYPIRMKNHQQQRIFSYDKPNKYRTDINTIYEVISLIDLPSLKFILQKMSDKKENNEDNGIVKQIVEVYREEIMQRNEYEFETLIRAVLSSYKSKENREILGQVSHLQPILQQIIAKTNKTSQL